MPTTLDSINKYLLEESVFHKVWKTGNTPYKAYPLTSPFECETFAEPRLLNYLSQKHGCCGAM